MTFEDLKKGTVFSSFLELEEVVNRYKKTVGCNLTKCSAKKLESSLKLAPKLINKALKENPDLIYYCIRYKCVKGKRFVPKPGSKKENLR